VYFTDARLKKMVVPQLKESIGRPVNIEHMSLTFFKTFPHPGVEISGMMVPGKTKSDTLLSLRQLVVGVKLIPLIGHNIVITELDIDKPDFTYIVYPDSTTNLDFLLNEQPSDTTSSAYNIAIPYFQIHHAYFGYHDYTTHTRAAVHNLNGNLSLSYADSITSRIDVKAERFSATLDSVNYISGLPLSLSEKSTLYPDRELIRLNKGHFSVHGLKMDLTGSIANWDQAPKVNLQLQSSSDDFGELLQLMPEAYRDYTKGLQTKGSLTLNGSIRGVIAQDQLPDFDIKMAVRNGYMKDPDLSQPVQNIQLTARATNKLLTIDTLTATAGKNKLSGSVRIENPLKDEGAFRMNFLADADLSTVHQFYDLSQMDVKKLDGILNIDANVNGRRHESGDITFNSNTMGHVRLKNVAFSGEASPQPVKNLNMNLQLSADKAVLHTFTADIGESDMNIRGSLTHYLAYLKQESSREETSLLTGYFSSNYLNLDELMSGGGKTTFKPQLPDMNTQLSAHIKRMKIAGVTMQNLQAKATTTPVQVHLEKASVHLFDGKASGTMRWKIPDGKPSTFNFKGSLNGLQLSSFFKEYPILGEDSQFYKYIKGNFSSQVDYHTKIDTMLSPILSTTALNGTLSMDKASVSNHPLQKKLVHYTHISQLNDISLDSWQSTVTVENSILTFKNLSLTSDNIGLKLNGTEQLMSGDIDFHISLLLPDRYQSKVASLIGKQAIKAFTSKDGGVMLPLHITGTYEDPSIKPDQAIIKKAIKNKVKNKAKDIFKNIFNL
jgi:hypothetical protein